MEEISTVSDKAWFALNKLIAKYPPIHLAADGIVVDLFNQLDENEIHLKKVLVPLVTLT